MAKKILIAGLTFDKKKDFVEYYKERAEEHFRNRTKIKTGHPDFEFYVECLKNHSKAEEKLRLPPTIFWFEFTGGCPELNFKNIKGDADHASYKEFFKKRDSEMTELKQAMRTAVESQIIKFRIDSERKCMACGDSGDFIKLEVDHADPTFIEILNEFVEVNKDCLPKTFDSKSRSDNKLTFEVKDKNFELRWQCHHFEKAKLQMLCVNCHKLKTNKKPE